MCIYIYFLKKILYLYPIIPYDLQSETLPQAENSWNVQLGMIPRILTIIPVTENSEVLFIHPDITPVYITNTFYWKGSW